MNRKDRDAKGIAPIQPELKILMLLQIIQIWQLILENQTEQVFQCLSVVVTEDFKNPKHFDGKAVRCTTKENTK
jgi:predicted metalloendopeptidase